MNKKHLMSVILLASIICMNGCTRIAKMHPTSGPPGTAVQIKSEGLWGSPTDYIVEWDGETICDPFAGSFVVPADAKPGPHKVTLIDQVDWAEVNLIFPLLRIRHDSETFTIIAPYAYEQEYLNQIASEDNINNF